MVDGWYRKFWSGGNTYLFDTIDAGGLVFEDSLDPWHRFGRSFEPLWLTMFDKSTCEYVYLFNIYIYKLLYMYMRVFLLILLFQLKLFSGTKAEGDAHRCPSCQSGDH